MSNRNRFIMTAIGALMLASIATPASAAFLLRTTLARVAGEDPSVSAACPAAGDARWDGVRIRVTLGNMDPARFPAGCSAQVTVGGISANVPLVLAPALDCVPVVDATSADFRTTGVVTKGSTATVRVRCTVAGVRHETRWAGTF